MRRSAQNRLSIGRSLGRRLLFLGLLAALGTSPATPTASAEPPAGEASRPNIVFIMSDDHGWQAVSAYGRPDGVRVNATPAIDRLAAEGARFDQFHVENALCGPSRAAFLTGCVSARHGFRQNGDRFDGSQPTWPALLQKSGYRTGMFGKWHLGTTPVGFDDYAILKGQGPYYNPPLLRPGGETRVHGYTTDIITDEGIAALRRFADASKADGRPFAICIQHKAPHRRWAPAPRHFHLYDHVDIPEPPTLLDDWSGRGPASAMQTMTVSNHLDREDLKLKSPWELDAGQKAIWDLHYGPGVAAYEAAVASGELAGDDLVRAKYQRYAKDYLACIQAVDDGVGRVLAEIDELGLADDTIVIYTSDQGWYLGEHGWYDKRWMYEESFRTPFIIRWPGHIAPGTTTDILAQNIDMAPTFMELAGVDAPDRVQGRSLAGFLKGGAVEVPDDWRDAVYYHFYEARGPHTVPEHDGVKTDRWKLIWFPAVDPDGDGPAGPGCWELYDLVSDPEEMTSLADDPAYAEVKAGLASRLGEMRGEYEGR